jgi:hypothetical protein
MGDIIRLFVGGALRGTLQSLAGALVAAGALAPGEKSHFIVIANGLLLSAASFAWSAWQKLDHAATLKKLKDIQNGQHA